MEGLNAYQCFYCFEIANFPGFLKVGENFPCTSYKPIYTCAQIRQSRLRPPVKSMSNWKVRVCFVCQEIA